MADIVEELRPMGRITSLSTLDERFHLSRSRLQTESEAEAHRSELARFIIENGWDGKYKPVTTAVYHEKYVEAMSAEIDLLRLSISEARAAGYREAYEVRMKKFRSGCACHMNDSDEIVSMCQHHEALVAEASATGRREGLSEAAKIAEGNAKYFDFQQALVDWDDKLVGGQSARLEIAAAIRAAMEKAE